MIPADAPLSVRRLPDEFERLAAEGDLDRAERALRGVPPLLVSLPRATPTKKIVELIELGARAVASIAIDRSAGPSVLNRGRSTSLIPLQLCRQQLLQPAIRRAPGAIEASCRVAGVEAEAELTIGLQQGKSLENQRTSIERATRVLAEHFAFLRRPMLSEVVADVESLEDAMRLPVERVVDLALKSDRAEALEDLILSVVSENSIGTTTSDTDKLQVVSVYAGAIGRRVVTEIATSDTPDVVEVFTAESGLLGASSRVLAQLGRDRAAADRLQHFVDRAADALVVELNAKMIELVSDDVADFDPRPRYAAIVGFASTSRMVRMVDVADDLLRDSVSALVDFSESRLKSLSRQLDYVFNDGLEIPEDSARMIGDRVQVDRVTPGAPLGIFVREGLWNVLNHAGLAGRLDEPRNEPGWRLLWRELAFPSDNNNLWETLGVDSTIKEAAIGEAALRARLALIVNALDAEARLNTEYRGLFLELWNSDLQLPQYEGDDQGAHSPRAILVSNCARRVTETMVAIGQRVSIDDYLVNTFTEIDVHSRFGQHTSEPEDLAELSLLTLASVGATRSDGAGNAPSFVSQAIDRLSQRYGMTPEYGASVSAGLFSDLTPRPEDSSY